jgi:hypothetical protein
MESATAYPSMKNSASKFLAPDAPECTTYLADPTGCKNTSYVQRVLAHILWKKHRANPSKKNSVSMFRVMDTPECTT